MHTKVARTRHPPSTEMLQDEGEEYFPGRDATMEKEAAHPNAGGRVIRYSDGQEISPHLARMITIGRQMVFCFMRSKGWRGSEPIRRSNAWYRGRNVPTVAVEWAWPMVLLEPNEVLISASPEHACARSLLASFPGSRAQLREATWEDRHYER
jgi:hypothetical protein